MSLENVTSNQQSIPPRPRILIIALFSWMSVTGGRFLAPFLEKEASFSESEIGITLAVQYGILGCLAPFYGVYADSREKKRPHFGRAQVLIVAVMIGSLGFLFHGLDRCWNHAFLSSFTFHFLSQCIYASCFAAMFPILDGMTVHYCEKFDSDSSAYGKERLYGAVSWGVTNMILGPLIDRFGVGVYYPCMVITAGFSIIVVCYYAEAHASFSAESARLNIKEVKAEKQEAKSSTGTQASEPLPSTTTLLVAAFGSAYGLAFGLCYFLLNSGFSVVENLVFLFFEFLGGSNTLCAFTVALTVMFEIPIFYLAPMMLRKYGVGIILLLACAAFWIRVVGYTLIPKGQPFWVFFIEPLHGFTYAGAQLSAVEFVQKRMPPGSEASGQGLVNLVRGAASVLGLWMGGFLEETWGPRFMYRVFVMAVSVGMGALGVAQARYNPDMQYEPIPDSNVMV